jgi:hypothetical protein
MTQGTRDDVSRPPESEGQSGPEAVLIIGAHREELGFGERVAEGLDPPIAVLRVPVGISGRRPRPDEVFYYKTRHRELYLQLRHQVRGRYRLVIDLHRGLNQPGRCADVFCRDAALLRCLQLRAQRRYGRETGTSLVRTVRLASRTGSGQPDMEADATESGKEPLGRTVIPAGVWDSEDFLYVGLEVYLGREGPGQEDDWEFARQLIRDTVACASTRSGHPLTDGAGKTESSG